MMWREPDVIPHLPGVFALANRKRRFVYVSFTSNLQKRSHSLSHMLTQHDDDPGCYWPIRDLPKHPSDEYVFMVMKSKDITEDNALAAVAAVQRQFAAKNYVLIGGNRARGADVTLNGVSMSLAEAVREHSKVQYLTAYRRLERGWGVEQALGLEPPDPAWHTGKQAERRARAKERAA